MPPFNGWLDIVQVFFFRLLLSLRFCQRVVIIISWNGISAAVRGIRRHCTTVWHRFNRIHFFPSFIVIRFLFRVCEVRPYEPLLCVRDPRNDVIRTILHWLSVARASERYRRNLNKHSKLKIYIRRSEKTNQTSSEAKEIYLRAQTCVLVEIRSICSDL